MILARLLLGLAALDSLALGLWAILLPDQLFSLLQLPVPADAFLWPWFGWLSLAHAVCLAGIAVWPVEYRNLALVPWVGRLLSCGMWLWLLNTDSCRPAHAPLWWLLAHDAFWLLALTVFLVFRFAPAQEVRA